jgi:NAD(P)-dependent dehydrogenase (short-subunit alcohol dehydrogenase family)
MAERAAIVTGASSGIGLAIGRALLEEGYALTAVARRPEKLEAAVRELERYGGDVQPVAGDVSSEEAVCAAVAAHRDRFGRLDVLVNNAGVGIGQSVCELTTRYVDMQLAVNLRAAMLFYRECTELLKAAGQEERGALVVNTSSIAGKSGQPWLSVYSATKHGLVGFTQAMNKELAAAGVKSCALCPAFVDTAMTDYVKDAVPAERMIQADDIAEALRMLLRLSRWCLIPEIVFQRVGETGA